MAELRVRRGPKGPKIASLATGADRREQSRPRREVRLHLAWRMRRRQPCPCLPSLTI